MLQELRKEIAELIEWKEADFPSTAKTDIDAVAHRILRMAAIMRKMRQIAERN